MRHMPKPTDHPHHQRPERIFCLEITMWVKIDDQFPTHPKIMKAGLEGRALFVTSLCYSANHLTDGFITVEVTPLLTAMSQISNGDSAVKKLLEVGLWEKCDGGYMIHDFLVYNPPSDKILEERRANAERQARFRDQRNKSRNGVTNGVTNTPPVPVPVPVHKNTKSAEKAPRPRDPLFDAIAEVCNVDPATAGSSIAKVEQALKKADPPYTPEEVRAFGVKWWEWKERTDPPTIWKLKEQIGTVRQNGNGTHKAEPIQPAPRKVYQ